MFKVNKKTITPSSLYIDKSGPLIGTLVPLWIEHDTACGSHPVWAQVVVELGSHDTIVTMCADDLSPHCFLVVLSDYDESNLLTKIVRSVLLVISALDLKK